MSKILCVDDNSQITEVLRDGLSQAGFTVVAASEAAQALELVARLHPDLVLLGSNLHGTDSLDLCTCLRTDLDIPVIMITERADDNDVVAGFEHGADDYVTKPFHLGILVQRIEAVLRYNRPTSAAR